jgi:hypothetical protein
MTARTQLAIAGDCIGIAPLTGHTSKLDASTPWLHAKINAAS